MKNNAKSEVRGQNEKFSEKGFILRDTEKEV